MDSLYNFWFYGEIKPAVRGNSRNEPLLEAFQSSPRMQRVLTYRVRCLLEEASLSPPNNKRITNPAPRILLYERQRLKEPHGESTVPGKILVVDDSDDTREMMAKLLELESFTVVTAKDGSAGLNTAEAEHPDLIITDVNMPIMNGIEMIRRLRDTSSFADVPIMAITAYGNGVAKEALEAGANRATTKPIQFNTLMVEIKELMRTEGSTGTLKHQ